MDDLYEHYEERDYYNYDYVIESDGEYWYTEFYCLEEDADKYKPLFEKWAQTIEVSLNEEKVKINELNSQIIQSQ